jgi:hypothetical protein
MKKARVTEEQMLTILREADEKPVPAAIECQHRAIVSEC